MMPMGTQRRRVDRGHRVVRAQQLRQPRAFVTPADVARVRAATAARKTLWTPEELVASRAAGSCAAQPTWKVTASHNAAGGGRRADASRRWNTSAPQQPGMWFQVELPEAVPLTEIQFESPGGGAAAVAVARRGAAPERGTGSAPPADAPARPPAAGAAPQASRAAAAPASTPPPCGVIRASYKVEDSMNGTNWGRGRARRGARGRQPRSPSRRCARSSCGSRRPAPPSRRSIQRSSDPTELRSRSNIEAEGRVKTSSSSTLATRLSELSER